LALHILRRGAGFHDLQEPNPAAHGHAPLETTSATVVSCAVGTLMFLVILGLIKN
jgi:hypothetical protein